MPTYDDGNRKLKLGLWYTIEDWEREYQMPPLPDETSRMVRFRMGRRQGLDGLIMLHMASVYVPSAEWWQAHENISPERTVWDALRDFAPWINPNQMSMSLDIPV